MFLLATFCDKRGQILNMSWPKNKSSLFQVQRGTEGFYTTLKGITHTAGSGRFLVFVDYHVLHWVIQQILTQHWQTWTVTLWGFSKWQSSFGSLAQQSLFLRVHLRPNLPTSLQRLLALNEGRHWVHFTVINPSKKKKEKKEKKKRHKESWLDTGCFYWSFGSDYI